MQQVELFLAGLSRAGGVGSASVSPPPPMLNPRVRALPAWLIAPELASVLQHQERARPQAPLPDERRNMSGALRSKAPLLFCRGGLTALARDGVAAPHLGSGGLPAAAAAGWRQGAAAHQPSTASWASCLHTSAPRRSQEEATGGAAAELASSGLHFTPDASAAGGALIGLAGALGAAAAAAAIDLPTARRLCKTSCTRVTDVQKPCYLRPPIPREIAAGLRPRGARQNVQRPPPSASPHRRLAV